MARAYAAEGADVLVNDAVSEAPALELVDEIRSLVRKSVAVRAEVASKPEVEHIIAVAKAQFGRLDILVNNAGFTRPNMVHKMSEVEWDGVVNTHLKGPFPRVQAAFPFSREQPRKRPS